MEQGQDYDSTTTTIATPNLLQDKYSKLGGWLLFFVVLFLAYITVYTVIAIYYFPDVAYTVPYFLDAGKGNIGVAIVFSIIGTSVHLVLMTIIVVMILGKLKGFLKLFIICTSIVFLLLSLDVSLVASYPLLFPANGLAKDLIRLIAHIFILFYFINSVRIDAYMNNVELTSAPVVDPTAQAAPLDPELDALPTPLKEKYSKMGGWLLFFVVLIIIYIAICTVALILFFPLMLEIIPFLFKVDKIFLGVELLCVLIGMTAQVIILINIVVMIFKRRKKFLSVFIACIIVYLCALILDFHLATTYPELFPTYNIIRDAIWFVANILVLVYFMMSIRVRTYMGNIKLTSAPAVVLTAAQAAPLTPKATAETATAPTIESIALPMPEPVTPLSPGWYKNPASPENICWWDGQHWHLESRRPK